MTCRPQSTAAVSHNLSPHRIRHISIVAVVNDVAWRLAGTGEQRGRGGRTAAGDRPRNIAAARDARSPTKSLPRDASNQRLRNDFFPTDGPDT